VAALSREAGILTHLDGCAVPRLFEAGEWEGRPYLVLSWLSGIDANAAAQECRKSPDSRRELLCLCRSIIEAYTELHSRGVIHGDVHPRNLIVSSDGTVNIIDFGVGRHIQSDDNVMRGGVGFFFEPEFARALLNGRPVPASSEKSDQYAVAALLYLLLTSQHYTHFSLERDEQLRQIWKNDMDPFADSGTEPWPEAEALLAIALQKQADKRFPSMHDFARAWKLISAPPAFPPRAGGLLG
jgi:serine/threonine-protein kinase